MAHAILRLENLTKSFGRVKAVDGLSLEVEEGEVFTLLGPSGCGKTTALRLIAGLEDPDHGRILLRGQPIASVSERIFVPTNKRKMGMVFQSYAIWPHKTVFENVAYPLRVRHVRSREIKERVLRVLQMVGLLGLEARPATQLSGGQQQRVALARALVYEPAVLLLDEPFSNLDAKLREQMRVQLKLLLEQVRITTVFVTHDQVEALSLSDRVAVMNQGHIEQSGRPRDLYERPGTPFVRDFLGKTVLLKGTVADRADAPRLTIHLDGAPRRTLHAPATEKARPAPGMPVLVAMRPEDIHLTRDEGGQDSANELAGTVEALLFVGNHCECRVRLGGDEVISIQAPRSTLLREGEPVYLHVAPEAISVWPA